MQLEHYLKSLKSQPISQILLQFYDTVKDKSESEQIAAFQEYYNRTNEKMVASRDINFIEFTFAWSLKDTIAECLKILRHEL